MKKTLLGSFLFASLFAGSAYSQIFSEQFSNMIFVNGWQVIDGNNDGNNWQVYDMSTFPGPFQSQGYMALSASSLPGTTGLTPNDFIISPAIDLTGQASNTATMLTFKAGSDATTASGNYQEHFSVYVVSASNSDLASLLTATPVLEQTLTAGSVMSTFTVNITAYANLNDARLVFRHHGCTDEGTFYIDNILVESVSTAGIQSLEQAGDLAYPNPTVDGKVKIDNENVVSVHVLNLNGQKLGTFSRDNIDLSELNSGVYLLETLNLNNVKTVQRIVKK